MQTKGDYWRAEGEGVSWYLLQQPSPPGCRARASFVLNHRLSLRIGQILHKSQIWLSPRRPLSAVVASNETHLHEKRAITQSRHYHLCTNLKPHWISCQRQMMADKVQHLQTETSPPSLVHSKAEDLKYAGVEDSIADARRRTSPVAKRVFACAYTSSIRSIPASSGPAVLTSMHRMV